LVLFSVEPAAELLISLSLERDFEDYYGTVIAEFEVALDIVLFALLAAYI
jgi:hypothetical protein